MSASALQKKAAKVAGPLKPLAEAFASCFTLDRFDPAAMARVQFLGGKVPQPPSEEYVKQQDIISDALGWRTSNNGNELFLPGSDAYQAVAAITSPETAAIARRLWERRPEYAGGRSEIQRYYRGRTYGRHILSAQVIPLLSLLRSLSEGFPLADFMREYGPDNCLQRPLGFDPAHILALALDEGPDRDRLFARMRNIEAEYNSYAIGAFWKCQRDDVHEYLCEQLLQGDLDVDYFRPYDAPRRLDGLFAPVFTGARKALPHLFRLIMEKELYNRRSIRQALCYWTGLGVNFVFPYGSRANYPGQNVDEIDPAIWDKAFPLAWRCLTDDAYRRQCLAGDDLLAIFLALWAEGESGWEHIVPAAVNLIRTGGVNAKRAALYMSHQFSPEEFRVKATTAMLADDGNWSDPVLMALAVRNMQSIMTMRPIMVANEFGVPVEGDLQGFALTPDELRELSEVYRRVVSGIGLPSVVCQNTENFAIGGVKIFCAFEQADFLQIAKRFGNGHNWQWLDCF